MARQRPLHAFDKAGIGYETTLNALGVQKLRAYDVCTCGKAADDPVHALPAATPKPKLPEFRAGERVEWDATAEIPGAWFSMPAGMGTVVSWSRMLDEPVGKIRVVIKCDDCPSNHTLYAKDLRRVVPVPKFASVEEAQAWLEANA